MEAKLAQAAARLAQAQRLVVLTGAGISKESGIPTFREAQEGLWARYDPMEMASPEGFRRSPRLVWEWYEYRYGLIKAAQPNAGHHAIAALERLIPTVTVVTQNIDGLHRAAGSSTVLELHGSIHRYKCFSRNHDGFTAWDFAGHAAKPPPCPACGDLLRPDVVWFGEPLPQDVFQEAYDACTRCDALLITGTSGVVYPAASLPYVAAGRGAFLVDVNPERDEISESADVFLQGKGGDVLPRLVEAIAAKR